MVELVTEDGWKFWASSEVIIGDKCYDMEKLNPTQKHFVAAKLNEQAMNAAFAGQIKFEAVDIPTFEEAFGGEVEV